MVLVFFADGTSREIFGAISVELANDKVLIKNRRGGLINVFQASEVIRAEVRERGETKKILVGGAKQ